MSSTASGSPSSLASAAIRRITRRTIRSRIASTSWLVGTGCITGLGKPGVARLDCGVRFQFLALDERRFRAGFGFSSGTSAWNSDTPGAKILRFVRRIEDVEAVPRARNRYLAFGRIGASA
jgi:hypothetical protein